MTIMVPLMHNYQNQLHPPPVTGQDLLSQFVSSYKKHSTCPAAELKEFMLRKDETFSSRFYEKFWQKTQLLSKKLRCWRA